MEFTEFKHNQSAHCETGVINTLFEEKGLEISEVMAFGIGSGLFFVYLPFVKVMGNPLVSYRNMPGAIFKKCCKRLGVSYEMESFRKPMQGVQRLETLLNENKILGLQTNIYWLPYIPSKFRFHFNAHNIVVYGKDSKNYFVSDPVVEDLEPCPKPSMNKARFAGGPLAPKGLLYYIKDNQTLHNLEKAVHQGIKETVRRMLYTPIPLFGIGAMKSLARAIEKWPKKLGEEQAKLYLGSVIRMQEEIGTGGAGFRYMYSGFLAESGNLFKNKVLQEASHKMELVADHWRNFAMASVSLVKNRGEASFSDIANQLREIAAAEADVYRYLHREYL